MLARSVSSRFKWSCTVSSKTSRPPFSRAPAGKNHSPLQFRRKLPVNSFSNPRIFPGFSNDRDDGEESCQRFFTEKQVLPAAKAWQQETGAISTPTPNPSARSMRYARKCFWVYIRIRPCAYLWTYPCTYLRVYLRRKPGLTLFISLFPSFPVSPKEGR